ncbi:MAG: ribonuclease HI [Legionellales bacterium]|nr:ribonuclease HI [Legionellales bacterium]|tara:strand:- start:2975 stop:3409 length:435 start_codon:yes stop_codon:yes gene_type:complete
MSILEIYTDGACQGNPGPGGWGAIIYYPTGETKHLSGGDKETTNNRMEMQAVIEALSAVSKSERVVLYTDSQYLLKGITEWMPSWKRKSWRTASGSQVKNIDLWQQIDHYHQSLDIEWRWVKGHSGDPKNEAVDALARSAIAVS